MAMRRLVALFVLCLLPVQIVWASVSDYSEHESSNEPHFAHHNDSHAIDSGTPATDPLGSGSDIDLAHDHCHLAGFIGLLTEAVITTAIAVTVPTSEGGNPAFSSRVLERLERPKWHSLARPGETRRDP